MPIDYSKSKIYMIEPTCEYEEGDIYIGSTVRPLSERMSDHRKPSNNCSSKLLFQKYGVSNCKIVLIEECPCETKEQLLKKEGEHIRSKKCVNKQIVGRTVVEKVEKYTTYNNSHKEEHKQYAIDNQAKIKIYQQDYRNKHKEKTKEYDKNNRERANELRRLRTTSSV